MSGSVWTPVAPQDRCAGDDGHPTSIALSDDGQVVLLRPAQPVDDEMPDAIVEDPLAGRPRTPPLPRLLRLVGGGMLVAAAATFLVHRWGAGNDIVRYLWLVGLTGAMSAAGWFSGLRLGDGKSARVLLGLVLAITPVHFTVLGGLLYSQFAWDPLPLVIDRPLWDAPSAFSAAATALFAVPLLAGMCWVSLRVFVREHASALTLAFTGICAVLLVPLRDPGFIAMLVAATTVAVVHLQQRVFADHGPLATGEGRAARALLAAPVLILVGRTLHLYDPTQTFIGAMLLAASYAGFAWMPHLGGPRAALASAQTFVGLSAAVGVSLLCDAIVGWAGLDGAARVLASGLPIAATWLALSTRAIEAVHLRRAAALAVAGTGLVTLGFAPGVVATLACIVLGIATLSYGVSTRQLTAAAAGALTVGVGVVHALSRIVDTEMLTHWAALSALGIVLVLVASFIERQGNALRGRFDRVRDELRAWEV